MLWLVLSVPIALGVGLIMYGIADAQILWRSTAIAWGILLIFGSIVIGIREHRYKNRKNNSSPVRTQSIQSERKRKQTPINLSETEMTILLFLVEIGSESKETAEIAATLKLHYQKTQLALDRLVCLKLVDKSADSYMEDVHPKYSLSKKGRIYLNNNGLL